MNALFFELESIAPGWYNFGLVLGIDVHELEKIQTDCRECDMCLVQVLWKWLKSDANASWNDVVAVVRSSVIANKHLADTIQSRYCMDMKTSG